MKAPAMAATWGFAAMGMYAHWYMGLREVMGPHEEWARLPATLKLTENVAARMAAVALLWHIKSISPIVTTCLDTPTSKGYN